MSSIKEPRFQKVPSLLLERRQWVAWRVEERNSKLTKVPVNPRTGALAATNHPETWASFEEACRRAETDGLAGVGYVFTADDGLTGVDLDKCRDLETGAIEQWALDIVSQLDSYTELSPSQRGLHILVRGKLPDGARRKERLEMYDRGRYFTVTGDHLASTPTEIMPREGELWNLHARLFGPFDASINSNEGRLQPFAPLSDHDLIQRARAAKNGSKFSRLWDGDWQNEGYPSQSEADQALCNLLAFWTEKDPARIDRLFRASGLFRPKWDETHFSDGRTYGEETINQSLALIREGYGSLTNRRRLVEDLKADHCATQEHSTFSQDRPTIDAGMQDLSVVTELSWQAIEGANQPPRLFLFGELPSRLELSEHGAPTLKELTIDRLRHEVARAARWVQFKRNAEHDAKPPVDVVKDMLACPAIPLPQLTRIVETPVFGRSGALLWTPGYHEQDQIYYAASQQLAIPSIPAEPTAEHVKEATRLLCEEFLGDFPFVNESGRAHALACLLLPFVRDLIEGPTPLHLIEKPTPRTGGTLLAAMLVLPAVGRAVIHVTEVRDDDEWGKLITALLRNSPVAICIDNLRRRLESSQLASAITSTRWSGRILGHTEKITVPVRSVWLATGNNPTLSDEMVGRTVFIRLDAYLDRPQDRTQFRHALPEWALQHRADLIHAALTLCQAWIAAGRPTDKARKGDFAAWSAVLGGILAHAGVSGFLAEPEPASADPLAQAWLQFIGWWWASYEDKAMGVSDLYKLINPQGDCTDVIDLEIGEGSPRSQKICLGKRLMERRDRQFSVDPAYRLQLVAASHRQRAQLWKLKKIPREGSASECVNVSECFSTTSEDVSAPDGIVCGGR